MLEAESRAQAVPLLCAGPLSLVVCQVLGFGRLLRDLERHPPGTQRAVLCPDGSWALKLLSDLASEGYGFFTIYEHSPPALPALLEPRSSTRVAPFEPLEASFVAGGSQLLADVVEVGNDGLGLALATSAPWERLTPGLRLEQARVYGHSGEVLEPRTWVVRTLRREPRGIGRVHVGVSVEAQARSQVGHRSSPRRGEIPAHTTGAE